MAKKPKKPPKPPKIKAADVHGMIVRLCAILLRRGAVSTQEIAMIMGTA